MKSRFASLGVSIALTFLAACTGAEKSSMSTTTSTRYEDLTKLFGEWRDFQKPKLVDGVPDYSASAMSTQHHDLASYQGRLAAIDPSGWPIPQQVDYYVVRAEMNGLDFDHRLLRPWANNPAFYVTVFSSESDQPAREGPLAYGSVELWKYDFPLSAEVEARIAPAIAAIPGLLEQARTNLVGNQKDLWTYGARSIHEQSGVLADLSSRLTPERADLRASADKAKEATDAFAAWLDQKAPEKTEPSGIGVDNYDWYLKNVQLVPYTWHDEVVIMERELARAVSFLALEEKRNEGLPEPQPITSAEEHDRRFDEAVTEYMAFLKDHDILTVQDYLDPALRSKVGTFDPGPREFFTEVDYRDPEVMRTHGYHWFDKAFMVDEPNKSPIRQVALLYNIFNTRTEGHATGWEEMMLQAGMFDRRPRTRELIYILLAERAARALGDLRMHSNEFTLEQAAEFASENTPRGWLSLSGNLVRGEQHLYLQQPAYGTSYVIGKIEVEKILAERKRQLGDQFDLKEFMDAFNAAGLVPASLLRWELTGAMPDDVRHMLEPPSPEASASQGPR
jgi:Bacterial protein of unknown function (DUF885)